MGEFSESIVNQRFRLAFNELEKSNRIKGKSDIASKLGTYNHVINSILKGDRNITVEQLHKLFETYSISADFMFGLSDTLFVLGQDAILTRGKSEQRFLGASNRQNIVLVPDRALAGYALSTNTPQYLADFPRFSIPNLEGNLIAFEISGNSMEPTIANNDIVVCEALERGEPIRDNQVYVVVTDVVVAKRVQQVKDGIASVRALRLISDNEFYKPYEVSPEEVQQILRVKCRLTSHDIQ
jgi:hypothetical protein